MANKKKKEAVKVAKQPKTRETNLIISNTKADPVLLDVSAKDMTTEGLLGSMEPQGSTRNDLTITFRYNFDKIQKLKDIASVQTKQNWAEDRDKKQKRKAVQYTDLMREAIDEKYFGKE